MRRLEDLPKLPTGLFGLVGSVVTALVFLKRSIYMFVGIALVDLIIVAIASLVCTLLPKACYLELPYSSIYLSEFAALLTFGAITIAIGIWKFSFAETRLVERSTIIAEKLYDAAFEMQTRKQTETPGIIALKRLAEGLARIATTGQIQEREFDQMLRDVASSPEMHDPELRVGWFVGALEAKIPAADRWIWQEAVRSGLCHVVFCSLTLLTLALLPSFANNPAVAWASFVVVVIALQATIRFVAGESKAMNSSK